MRHILQKKTSFLSLAILNSLLIIILVIRLSGHELSLLLLVLLFDLIFVAGSKIWAGYHVKDRIRSNEIPASYTLGFDFLLLLFIVWPHFLSQTIATGIGFFFFLIGLLILFTPPNQAIGIRLPPTYNSPEVWKKVNYLGGWLFALAGLFTILLGNLWPNDTIVIMLVTIVIAGGISTGYAYWLPQS